MIPEDRREKFCIVGAGFCGLGVSAAFARRGIPFDALEADDAVGGNWYHGVYETAHIISSRKTTEYSDWPMPADWPDFPSSSQMCEYLNAYADNFGLREHIELNTRVALCEPIPGSDDWRVTLEDGRVRRYRGVVIANGHHWDMRWPGYRGELDCERIHSKQYKSPEVLKGKRVLVIGGGNSACDIAVESARFAESAHVSTRRGYWFMPKTMLGIPTVELIKPWMPLATQRLFLRAMLRLIVGRYERYGLPHPDHRIFERHPTINSELLYHLRHGRITAHPDVARWDGDGVEFVDGTRERFDLVVCATGYHMSIPFLPESVLGYEDGIPQMINGLLHPEHKNLYLFGLGQPRYGAGPLITEGARTLCTIVAAQEKLEHPLGAVLARMGARPLKSVLLDPHRVLRETRRARRIVPHLHRVERVLMRNAA